MTWIWQDARSIDNWGRSVNDTHTLGGIVLHSGITNQPGLDAAIAKGVTLLNATPANAEQRINVGDEIQLSKGRYRVISGGGEGRLQLETIKQDIPERISGITRVHCGYHKCLTEYSKKVYSSVCKGKLPGTSHGSFAHFFHRADAFYNECNQHYINSVSGHALTLDRFEDIRVVRFIRDPRDLIISGYFYHKRAAEHWCALKNPTETDWAMVRGYIPRKLPSDFSLTEYLNSTSLEEGLIAEMDFRTHHYNSMLEWPDNDPRVRLYRYEDILGNEADTFRSIVSFLGLPLLTRIAGVHYARRFRAKRNIGKTSHIRNPNSQQWRQHFTPTLTAMFKERFSEVLQRYDYPLE